MIDRPVHSDRKVHVAVRQPRAVLRGQECNLHTNGLAGTIERTPPHDSCLARKLQCSGEMLAARPSRRVLIVDDEASIRKVILDVLTADGYVVDQATNGADAIIRMRVSLPDAMVLDLMMPVMDGRTLVGAMRQDQSLTGVPFILISASISLQDACKELAAQGCLNKPFEIDAVLAAVHKLLP